MPWSTDDVERHKKGLGAKEKRQWVRVANAALKKGMSDAQAIRMANGVVGGHKSLYADGGRVTPDEEKCYGELYQEVWRAFGGAVSFEEVDSYFAARDDAGKVEDLTYQFRNLVDNILADDEVEDKAMAIGQLASDYQSRLTSGEVPGYKAQDQSPDAAHPITLTKDARTGLTRVTFIVSNKYRDHDAVPEILSESAHLQWAAQSQGLKFDSSRVDVKTVDPDYLPVVQLWHTPGTEWADIDHVDVVDGFLIESGVVRTGYEQLAKDIADDPLMGISHGYKVTERDTADWSVVNSYRQFEVSALPLRWAANILTGVLGSKEANEMDANKRKFLVDKMGEAKVAELEGRVKGLNEVAAELGLDSKDLVGALSSPVSVSSKVNPEPEPEPGTPDPTPDPEPEPGTPTGDDKGLGAMTALQGIISKAVQEAVETAVGAQFKGVNTYLVELGGRVGDIEGGLTRAVAKEIAPKAAQGSYIWEGRPSESKDNLMSKEDAGSPVPSNTDAELDSLLQALYPGGR